MKIGYKFRFYPTEAQKASLAKVFGCARFVYNWGLRLRTDSYKSGDPVGYARSSSLLTKLKQQEKYAWLNEVSCVPTQQALRHLQTAYKNFFEKRTRYPKFKSKRDKQAAEYTRSAFKWDSGNKNLVLAKIGRLQVRWSRRFESSPSTVTITKDRAGRYFATLTLDEHRPDLPKTGEAVGIDLGISRLATLSNGERIGNPKHLRKQEEKLARAKRIFSRRQKGSNRRERQRLKVARITAKIADSRKDYLDKVTTILVRRFDVLCIEDLDVRGLLRQKKLSKYLSDVALGMMLRLLEYKASMYGKTAVKVDRYFPSSRTCNCCGFILEYLPLCLREWDCPKCKTHHDRDENAAKNILAVGHTVTARGEDVRPSSAKAKPGRPRGSVNHFVVRV